MAELSGEERVDERVDHGIGGGSDVGQVFDKLASGGEQVYIEHLEDVPHVEGRPTKHERDYQNQNYPEWELELASIRMRGGFYVGNPIPSKKSQSRDFKSHRIFAKTSGIPIPKAPQHFRKSRKSKKS